MPQRNRVLFLFVLILLFVLGTGFLLAYGPVTPPDTATPNEAAAPQATAELDNWPMLRHDSGRSGYNANIGSFHPPLALFDKIQLDDQSNDGHQILDLTAGSKRIYAMGQYIIWGIDKDDPSAQWSNDDCLPSQIGACFNTYMAYVADRLVVLRQNFIISPPDFGYELVVLNAATGSEIWSRSLGETAPEIALEGSSILLLTEESSVGKLTKLTLSGSQLFKKSADIAGSADGVAPVGAVVGGDRFIYANGDRILAYRTDNGQQSWIYTPTPHISTYGYDLVATADAVIVSHDERVIKLNVADGGFLWEKDIQPASCNSDLGPNTAATDGNTIAVTGVCDREVVGLNYNSGAEMWRNDLRSVGSASAIAIGGNTLYAAAVVTTTELLTPTLFTIFAIDAGGGTELETIELDPNESSSVLAISDGLLLTASNIGTERIHRFERTPADLAAEMSLESLPICGASIGGTVTFNFLVTNHGPGTTDNTQADLTLPDGDTTLNASTGSCTAGASPFCNLGALSVGQQVYITATVVLSEAGSYSPGISLSGEVRDPDEKNDSDAQPLTVDPVTPAGLDLLLTDIEITQGIQNLANEVPLVNGKPTFVRVYGRTNGDPVMNVSAVLHGERSLSGEDLGTLTPIPAAACLALDGDTPDRDRLADSFVFELPESWWQGGVIFTAEINPGGAIPDDNSGNDTLTIARGFTRLPRVCLKTYPVRTTGKQTASSPETDNLFPDPWSIADDAGNILSRAFTMLPVREIKVYPSSHLIEEWEPFAEGGYGPYEMFKSEDNREDVLDTLWWLNLFSDDPDLCDADDSLTHYVGMVHQGTENTVGSAGLGIRDGDELMLFLNTGPNGPQAFDDPHGGLTLAHEIGHNYDRGHVNCGKPEDTDKHYPKDRSRCNIAPDDDPRTYFGLEFRDPTAPTVITPTMAGDVMSYAGDVWPSEYTWEAIQKKLCDANDCPLNLIPPLAVSAAPPPPLTGDVLVIRGHISPTAALQDAYRLPVSEVPKADELWAEQVASRPLTATYALNLISGTTILHSEPFSPTVLADQETLLSSFGLVIPWEPATTRVELSVDGATAFSLTVSPSPPTVTALSPNGGESFTDTLPVSWTASDPDGDDLRYSVLYSHDGGASWQALTTGVQTPTHTADISLLPGSDGQGLVKVIATDGLNYAFRQSAAGFTIPNRSPRAAIFFPDDDGEYPSGSPLTLRGAVYDPEDSLITDTVVMSWTLSGAGFLGGGNNIVLDDLEDGDYSLTLTAFDSNGQMGNDTISFRIGEVAEPSGLYIPFILKHP